MYRVRSLKKYLLCGCLFVAVTVCPFIKILVVCAEDTKKPATGQLTIFYAAGLNASMNAMFKEFKELYPEVEIIGESSGTLLAIRKITELNREADMIFVADEISIKNMLIPKYADWYIRLYKDRVVLAYTDKSKYTSEINPQNWYKILLTKGVRYSYANPNLAPIGYRTIMVWQLADLYYKEKIDGKSISEALKASCLQEYVVPEVAEMLHLLEAPTLDYGFIYESIAKQHNLKYLRLPEEIDLGNEKLADFYKQTKVEVTSKKTGSKDTIVGSPITFAFTILKDTKNLQVAVEFAKLFLGPDGQQIMLANDQPMLVPCVANNRDLIPEELKQFVVSD